MSQEKWECYLCGVEHKMKILPSGYLGNYHPICLNCADVIFFDSKNQNRSRLTYHINFGDLFFYENTFVSINNYQSN